MPLPDGQRRVGRFLWGPRRARLGLSIRQLQELSGVNRGDLSKAENGRMVPSADAFEKVMAALEAAEPPSLSPSLGAALSGLVSSETAPSDGLSSHRRPGDDDTAAVRP